MVSMKPSRSHFLRSATAAAGLTLAGFAALSIYGLASFSAQLFGSTVHRGRGRRRSVALTFDDGPSSQTPDLLALLAEHGIPATFFQCGLNVRRHPEIARAVTAAGHEVGNHTFTHARLPPQLSRRPNLRSPRNIFGEVAATQIAIQEATGVTPTLFRAPYGMRWWGLRSTQRRLGLVGVLWTVIGHDWEWAAEQIAQFVLDRVEPGGIVCLHDGRDIQPQVDLSGMLSALRVIVPALKAQGYSFETVSELLRPDKRDDVAAKTAISRNPVRP